MEELVFMLSIYNFHLHIRWSNVIFPTGLRMYTMVVIVVIYRWKHIYNFFFRRTPTPTISNMVYIISSRTFPATIYTHTTTYQYICSLVS
jgi:hypothetical protein